MLLVVSVDDRMALDERLYCVREPTKFLKEVADFFRRLVWRVNDEGDSWFHNVLLLCTTALIYSKFTLKCQEQEKIFDSVI